MIMATKPLRAADLSSRVMLVQLSVSQWTARKLDRKVTDQVARENDAKRDVGRYNKVLVARGALAAIAAIVTDARQDHATYTLPWLQDGTRIMPVDAFKTYAAKMQGHRERMLAEVREFVASYDDYIAQARVDLGALFNAGDYPTAREVGQKFKFNVTALPMPNVSDFRVDLDKDTVAALQADMQADIQAAMGAAVKDVAERLYTVARAMSDKLTAYAPDLGKQGNPFRDSLVENVRELVSVLPMLNVTGDARLSKAIDDAREKLVRHDAQDLREDEALRAETAQAAADIADAMAAFMG
jgi:hypothetical protein